MVADAPEADWNARRRQLDTLQQKHDRQRQSDRKLLSTNIRAINELLETCSDRQIVERLNARGYKKWKGESFTYKKIIVTRTAYLGIQIPEQVERHFHAARSCAFQTGFAVRRFNALAAYRQALRFPVSGRTLLGFQRRARRFQNGIFLSSMSVRSTSPVPTPEVTGRQNLPNCSAKHGTYPAYSIQPLPRR